LVLWLIVALFCVESGSAIVWRLPGVS
jgi:hypothetical protein